jgi:general secretion pathway protein H
VLKNNKAFSLLEIVIVLSIMGAIIGIALPRLTDKKIDIRKVLREFGTAGKDLKGRAKLNGTTYRLAFQLEPS